MKKATRLLMAFLKAGTLFGGDFAIVGLGVDAAVNRAVIQAAVDAACARGGGRVVIPPGEWLSGSLELKNGVELYLPKGAVLKGSTNRSDYNANDAFPENKWSDAEEWSGGHLVWARCATNVAITGEGTIDGNGPAFFGECDEDSRWPYYRSGLKLHPTDREWFRPGMMVAFFRCGDVRISGITLARTPAWTCHLRCCDGVDIRNVTIDADRTIANSDGFSIDCTRNVHVEGCTVRSGDDGFAIRASCALHADANFCENIIITNCDIWSYCYAIRVGIGSGMIRNVEVVDTRIHESAEFGIGFTPAWVSGEKDCYIEDIRFRHCEVSDCIYPIGGGPSAGDSHVTNISFENCVFNTLLPIRVAGGERCTMFFLNCTRNAIERFSSLHRQGWREREIRNKRSVFVEIGGDRSRIAVTSCRPQPFGETGVLLLSFDDRNFDDWERAVPLFAKYGAHATFFIHGDFDTAAVKTAKRLMAHGHSIGLHGRHHANVPEAIAAQGEKDYFVSEISAVRRQCDVAYIPVRSFAYPNCRRDERSDQILLKSFERLRGGLSDVRLYDPKGEKRSGLKPLVTDGRVFFPVAELPTRRLLNAVLIGEAYNTDIDDVVACVKRAGVHKEVLVLASHGISPDAKHINMKSEWLERVLAAAKESGVAVLGYDEIPLF